MTENDRIEPAAAARESRNMTKGLDAMNDGEWRETAEFCMAALEQIRLLPTQSIEARDGGNHRTFLLASDVHRLVEDALAEARRE